MTIPAKARTNKGPRVVILQIEELLAVPDSVTLAALEGKEIRRVVSEELMPSMALSLVNARKEGKRLADLRERFDLSNIVRPAYGEAQLRRQVNINRVRILAWLQGEEKAHAGDKEQIDYGLAKMQAIELKEATSLYYLAIVDCWNPSIGWIESNFTIAALYGIAYEIRIRGMPDAILKEIVVRDALDQLTKVVLRRLSERELMKQPTGLLSIPYPAEEQGADLAGPLPQH